MEKREVEGRKTETRNGSGMGTLEHGQGRRGEIQVVRELTYPFRAAVLKLYAATL